MWPSVSDAVLAKDRWHREGASGAVSQADQPRLQRLGLAKAQSAPLPDVLEQRRSSTEDDGVHDQADLVDQTLVHQTADERGAADGMHVLAGLLLHLSDLFEISNDPGVIPGDRVQRPG